MRSEANVFHLAIPCHDLEKAREYYEALGCEIARSYNDRITINFFGDQVVCHFDPDYELPELKMYPRHFGITFKTADEFDEIRLRAEEKNLPFFKDVFVRFEGKPEEHKTFLLVDPSHNLLEFKWYNEPAMMY